MSETAPERPQRGNAFTKKYGPLPGWGWAGLAALAAVGVWWYRNRQSQQAAQAAQANTAASGPGTDYGPQIATLQSEIQQLQGAGSTTPAGEGAPSHTAVTADGKKTLNQIASAHGTSAAAIADYMLRYKTSMTPTERKYLTGGNYAAKIPRGLTIWIPGTSQLEAS